MMNDDISDGEKVASAILDTLISPNEQDVNLERANVVDGLFAIARALDRIAHRLNDSEVIEEAALTLRHAIDEHRRAIDAFTETQERS